MAQASAPSNVASDGHLPCVATQTYEIADRETIDTLLVPKIEDPAIRAGTVEELMRTVVPPALHASPAGSALGYDVRWTCGDFRPPAG